MASGTNLDAVEAQARAAARAEAATKAVFPILLSISFCHLLNDTVQSLIPAIYPLLKASFHLNYGQVGRIALTLQLTASLLQPVVGLYTDRRPQPYSLAVGMGITMVGLLAFAMAPTYLTILVAAAFVGIGSAVFHPESSRVARMASGGAIALPGWRKCGFGHRAVAGVYLYQGASQHRLVFVSGHAGHCAAHEYRRMVPQK